MRFARVLALGIGVGSLSVLLAAQPVAAQEWRLPDSIFTPSASSGSTPGLSTVGPIFVVPELPRFVAEPTQPVELSIAISKRVPRGDTALEPQRPRALAPLYGSLIALQALDVHSTYFALSRSEGAEANPLMQPIVENKLAFSLVKASSTAATLWLTEKVWKRNRKAAVIFTVAANVVMAAVVANNYRVAARPR